MFSPAGNFLSCGLDSAWVPGWPLWSVLEAHFLGSTRSTALEGTLPPAYWKNYERASSHAQWHFLSCEVEFLAHHPVVSLETTRGLPQEMMLSTWHSLVMAPLILFWG